METDYKKSASFFKEVHELPVIRAAGELYEGTKHRSRVLSSGLAVVEYSLNTVFGRFGLGSAIGECKYKHNTVNVY